MDIIEELLQTEKIEITRIYYGDNEFYVTLNIPVAKYTFYGEGSTISKAITRAMIRMASQYIDEVGENTKY